MKNIETALAFLHLERLWKDSPDQWTAWAVPQETAGRVVITLLTLRPRLDVIAIAAETKEGNEGMPVSPGRFFDASPDAVWWIN